MEETIIALLFIVNSIWDIYKKEILLVPSVLVGLLGLFGQKFFSMEIFVFLLFSILPGVCIMLLSKMTRGGIGFGDGILLLTVGIWDGPFYTILTLFFGCLIASISMLLKKLIKKSSKNDPERIPFVPYLMMGWLLAGGML